MCGLAGFLGTPSSKCNVLYKMVTSIKSRGPDHYGVWYDDEHNIAMAHARLAILDLSSAGHQPMSSSNERYIMIFNGEVYNHLALRQELEQFSENIWKGHSDTETLLAGFEYWGVRNTLEKCVGMFALVIWDSYEEKIILARDRFGEKPLYYGKQNGTFMFASELKALQVHPDFENKISRSALADYFRLNYIPTPFSIYENVFKLEPATIKTFSKTGDLLKSEIFWDLENIALKSELKNPSEADVLDDLELLIKNSIKGQQISDVPLGAFLSGGIDSSTVVGILQFISSRPIKTFTIGFEDTNFNEAGEAKEVARFLGTDHKELIVSADQALAVIDKLPTIYDEPFADASQIATYLVSQLAKKDVTVVLSGDGGDELFCGYNRYLYTQKVWSKLEKFPLALRKLLGNILLAVSSSAWDKFSKVLFLDKKIPNLGNKAQKSALVLKSGSILELYSRLVTNWQVEEHLVKGISAPRASLLSSMKDIDSLNDLEKMMLWDKQSYLMDGVLVKMDRATMACSLEGRVPLLDHRIAEFAATLPLDLKLRDGQGKWILRQVLYKYVPKDLIERPKKGFSLPIAEWLRGPLKNWAASLLETKRLEAEGFLEPNLVAQKWHEHLSGKRDWSAQLWSVLMFQLWLKNNPPN